MREQMSGLDFANEKRIKDVMMEIRSSMEQGFLSSGERLAMDTAQSAFLEEKYRSDLTGRVQFYEFLCDLLKDYDSKKDEQNLEELRKINPEGAENDNKYYAIMCVRHWPDLDALTDLNNYLYQACAKNTWLIPSEKYNEKTKKVEDYNYGEIGTFLIVIDY
jgi:Zn-dependent M16 (insulinase) family peptidase